MPFTKINLVKDKRNTNNITYFSLNMLRAIDKKKICKFFKRKGQ